MKNKKTNSNAFSLAETIIMIIVLAVVIVASTPFLTRKIQNISDAGITSGGGAHGRIEVFYQEFLDCEDDLDNCNKDGYKKTFDDDAKADESVIVYQKLNDKQYKNILNAYPQTLPNGEKEVAYAEIGKGKPIKSPDGAIIGATIGTLINTVTYPSEPGAGEASPEYVFENAYVTYRKDKKSIAPDRIIEGNYTKHIGEKSIPDIDGGKNKHCFVINTDKGGKFHLRYRYFPWLKKYVGKSKKPSEDRAIEAKELNSNGEYTYDLPTDTRDVVFHAVGGGGYGGGISNLNQPITPDSSEKTKKVIENRLLTAYKKATGKTGKVKFDETVNWEDYDGLVVDTVNKTITGRIVLREGETSVYPNKLLQYTQVLGTPSQKAVLYDMPDWFNGDMDGYRLGAVICSENGKKGKDSTFHVTKKCDWMEKCSISCNTRNGDICIQSHTTTCPNYRSSTDTGIDDHNNHVKDRPRGPDYQQMGAVRSKYSVTGCAANIKDSVWSFDNLKIKQDLTKLADADHWDDCKYESGCKSSKPSCTPETVCDEYNKLTDYTCTPSDHFSCVQDKGTKDGTVCPTAHESCKYNPFEVPCNGGAGGSGVCAWASVPVRINDKYSVSKIEYPERAGYGTGRTLTLKVFDRVAILKALGGQNGADCIGGATCTLADITTREDCRKAFLEGFYDPNNPVVGGVAARGEKGIDKYNEHICNIARPPTPGITADKGQDAPAPSCNWQGGGAISEGILSNGVYWKKGVPTSTDLGADGYAKGFGTSEKKEDYYGYNYLYLWTIPYGINSLSYGESGTPGKYAKANVKDVSGKILIKLGEGGNAKKPEGTSTTVNIDNKKILEAEGGKAGSSNKKTSMFDICFNVDSSKKNAIMTCDGAKGSIDCCMGHNAVKNTKNISATYIKYSEFEDISAYTNKSPIVGIGLGRGGMGLSSSTAVDEVKGARKAFNISTAAGGSVEIKSLENISTPAYPAPPANKILVSSNLNTYGGGGAVIIMW